MSESERAREEEQGERERSRKAIWLIDDNEELAQAFLRHTQVFNLEDTDFTYYQKGEEAVRDFERFAGMKDQLPAMILLDYMLDEARYHTGVEVIRALKEVCERRGVLLPEIIAFSSSDPNNMRLVNAGASRVVRKSDPKAIDDFLEHL